VRHQRQDKLLDTDWSEPLVVRTNQRRTGSYGRGLGVITARSNCLFRKNNGGETDASSNHLPGILVKYPPFFQTVSNEDFPGGSVKLTLWHVRLIPTTRGQ